MNCSLFLTFRPLNFLILRYLGQKYLEQIYYKFRLKTLGKCFLSLFWKNDKEKFEKNIYNVFGSNITVVVNWLKSTMAKIFGQLIKQPEIITLKSYFQDHIWQIYHGVHYKDIWRKWTKELSDRKMMFSPSQSTHQQCYFKNYLSTK